MEESANSKTTRNVASSSQTTLTHISPHTNPISVKLAEGNYLVWRQQVLATIRGYGLEPYLTGEQIMPPKMVASPETTKMEMNPNYVAWHRQDQLLAAWMQSSLAESTMVVMVGFTTSREIWKTLETGYASQSKAKVMQFKLQLQTLKKDGLTMSDYLNKIKICYDLLGSTGYKVLDEDQILHILSGLGSEYDPVMVTITSKSDGWSVQDVSALLLTFESRLETAKPTVINIDGSQPSANLLQAMDASIIEEATTMVVAEKEAAEETSEADEVAEEVELWAIVLSVNCARNLGTALLA